MLTVPRAILDLAARFAEHWARTPIIPQGKLGIPGWLRDAGFTAFSHGASRGALLGDHWIFKISLDPTRTEELEGELEVFQQYVGTPELAYLPHTEMVRQGEALVLIQERVTLDSAACRARMDELKAIAAKFQMQDLHEGNVGFRVLPTGARTPVIIDLGEHVPRRDAGSAVARGVPAALNKFLPNEADAAFLAGMAHLGVDPTQFQRQTHRRLG